MGNELLWGGDWGIDLNVIQKGIKVKELMLTVTSTCHWQFENKKFDFGAGLSLSSVLETWDQKLA